MPYVAAARGDAEQAETLITPCLVQRFCGWVSGMLLDVQVSRATLALHLRALLKQSCLPGATSTFLDVASSILRLLAIVANIEAGM